MRGVTSWIVKLSAEGCSPRTAPASSKRMSGRKNRGERYVCKIMNAWVEILILKLILGWILNIFSMNSNKFINLIFIGGWLALGACGPKSEPANHAESERQPPGLHTIHINGAPLKVEIAQTLEASRLGLMFRESLPEDQGMLFVFPQKHILSFWMRNTFIPLDIAFIDEAGVIVDIQRMAPLDETINYISAAPALYALEVNAGWFEKQGIKVGAQVKF